MARTSKKRTEPPKISRNYVEIVKNLLFDPFQIKWTCYLLILFDFFLNIFIIETVPYTEIDWKAYMQQVEGFLNGTYDYGLLKGDTGPLVYPAGFVYIYTFLYYLTDFGTSIRIAQYFFLVIYLVQIYLWHNLLIKTGKIPPFALIIITLTSYRIHSIYVLRLFNDPIAVLLFYIALNLWVNNKWRWGSLFYSLAVSVKMNILLYSPVLLVAYLTNLSIIETGINMAICGSVQLLLAIPFLITDPFAYVIGSFNLGRVFDYRWTVNFRFLSPELFVDRHFHTLLFTAHLIVLLIFMKHFWRYLKSYAKLRVIVDDLNKQIEDEKKKKRKDLNEDEWKLLEAYEEQLGGDKLEKSAKNFVKINQLLILPFFVANLIGITFARSLHYQFYSWYFHSLIYLVYSTSYGNPFRFLLLAVIEYCWNVYPSTVLSSVLLNCCHILLLWGIYKTMKV